jgi:WD40 repeat protein
LRRTQLQQEWKAKTIEYAQAVNQFVEKGLRDGWDNAGAEPKDNGREKLVPQLLKAIRHANETKEYEKLRQEWPLAHSPLVNELEKLGKSIPKLAVLNDGSIVARVGTHYQDGYVVQIKDENVIVIDDVEFFGVSPDNLFFAYTEDNGIRITKGWQGDESAFCPYPTGLEGIPAKYKVKPFDTPPKPTELIPFPDGQRVLFVSSDGIFVLSTEKAVRLLPAQDEIIEHFNWLKDEYPEDDLAMNLDMEHGAISSDGKFISVGSQDSSHLVYNDKYELVGDIGNQCDYPHFSLFSSDCKTLALNSCHFYNGVTVGIKTELLTGISTEPYEEDERITTLESQSRVYAGTHRDNEFIVGDAYGYIRAFDNEGKHTWQHFLGSSVGSLALSPDQKILVCSTYAGFISILKLDGETRAEYEIGTGNHSEVRRWLFWNGENQPLIW